MDDRSEKSAGRPPDPYSVRTGPLSQGAAAISSTKAPAASAPPAASVFDHVPAQLRDAGGGGEGADATAYRALPPLVLPAPAAAPSAARHIAVAVARGAALVFAGWLALVFGLILLYRFVDPPVSALMVQRSISGMSIAHAWAPIDDISPSLVRAVLVSEDGRFCQHWGVDLEAIQIAIERSGEGTPRGASTITMQVAKNLFLWPSKSYVRKAIELPLTLVLELFWPKKRIMEVYLNIAEWGPGIFGAEAAALHHFSKPAARLTAGEAARLAVSLPNPIRRDAGEPGPGTRRLARLIEARARAAYTTQTACVLTPGRGRPAAGKNWQTTTRPAP